MELVMASGQCCGCSNLSFASSSQSRRSAHHGKPVLVQPNRTVVQSRSLLPKTFLSGTCSPVIHLSGGTRLTPTRSPARRAARAALDALIFDCDGVILESEDLHRRAYNATFAHFNVCLPSSPAPVDWTTEFYDQLQNQIGGGKPKMRWYFNKNGWPSSSASGIPPESDADRENLIDVLQEWKTEKYKDLIGSGSVEPRPGVIRLMDEARAAGIKLAVCSAATKSSVVFCLTNLLGEERFGKLDCFLAGDDVDKKKPDPLIYKTAAQTLGVAPENALVVEDSLIGLQAALGAGMACIVSFTSSTSHQDFSGAKSTYPDLGNVSLTDLVKLVETAPAAV